jgi:Ankyrin repeats (3 copies)
MVAAEIGMLEVVKELIARGGNPAAKTTGFGGGFPGGVTALQLASQNGHLQVVQLLAEKGNHSR